MNNRISANPASAVLISYWDDAKSNWIPSELLVNEIETGLYTGTGSIGSGTAYDEMQDVIIGHTRYGANKEFTCGISLGTHHCKVIGGHSSIDDIVGEAGVFFTSAGDDIDFRLGIHEPFPTGSEPVYGRTGDDSCAEKGLKFKMERVMAAPTDRFVEFLNSHPDVSWRLGDFNR